MTARKIKGSRLIQVCVITASALALVLSACKPSAAGKSDQLAETGGGQGSAAVQSEIKVIYPVDLTPVPASTSFIVGSLPAGKQLLCDGAEVRMNAKGYFAHVVQLHPGINKFKLTEKENPAESREVTFMREIPRPQISANTFKLAIETAQPNEDCGYTVGDIIELSVHATPGASVRVQIGKRVIQLAPSAALRQKAKARKRVQAKVRSAANVNVGLDAAYGKVFQRTPGSAPDSYVGFYKVAADDNWQNVVPKFSLTANGKSTSAAPKALITTIHQPFIARTKHDRTVVRTGPGASRLTPLPEGVRLLADGWKGEEVRCAYSSTQHVWIPKEDLVFEAQPGETGALPQSPVRTINTNRDNYGDDIVVPLNQRLPFILEQHLKPSQLVMRIFGGTANTDWVSPTVPSGMETELVDNITWKQISDNTYELTAHLKNDRQWGFYADYQNSDLHLHVKRAPNIKATGEGRLDGLVICLDPGHGGSELGAIGCGGKREADINLGIALKLEALLKQRGAQVIMTRTDDRLVSLDDRVILAEKNHPDILLSIHNNSLPDGRDPWTEHGTSSYWYHPQAIDLARTLRTSEQQAIHFADLATRWQNLALTRPSAMLSVLYEVGFMINPDEYSVLEDEAGQQKSAEGLMNGLYTYLVPHQAPTRTETN